MKTKKAKPSKKDIKKKKPTKEKPTKIQFFNEKESENWIV